MNKLNEGKPFLRGEKLSARMKKLAVMVQGEHLKAREALSSALEHARNAGEWLTEAKWRTGHRTKWGRWSRWLTEEYQIAPRTQRLYMQVARHWDDSRIRQARSQGIAVDSIAAFLQVLRGCHPKSSSSLTTSEGEREDMEKNIRKEFAEYLRTLDSYELRILTTTLDDVLASTNADLKERVCGHYEGPYYKCRDEYHQEQGEKPKQPQTKPQTMANVDMREMKRVKWNSKIFRGNTEPDFKTPRKGRRRVVGNRLRSTTQLEGPTKRI